MDDTVKYKNYIFKKYILHKDIISRIKDVANCINEEYSHIAATSKEKPVFLGVLTGSIYFMMDLLKSINFDYEIDFIKIKSYSDMKQKNVVFENADISKYGNRNIIIIEDIIDSGNTINLLYDKIMDSNPEKCSIVTLLKKEKIKNFDEDKIDYYGFEIKNKYVIGYGLDINNLFRNLKDIYIKDGEEK